MEKKFLDLPFIKMHGLGNSYVYINTFQCSISENYLPSLAQMVSSSQTGIGSDGLILIGPSKVAAIRMRIFNKDGSEAKNCGNGLRCVAKYAYDQGLVSSRCMTIETGSGVVEATIENSVDSEAWVAVQMGQPRLARNQIPMIGANSAQIVAEPFPIGNKILSLTAISMGNPHAVFFVDHFSDSPHLQWGPLIEKDSRFPEGVNVDFVQVESQTRIRCKVWERGSGATQACGTGACAATVACILNGFCKKGVPIEVQLDGGVLSVTWKAQGLFMLGPAVTVASGRLNYKL